MRFFKKRSSTWARSWPCSHWWCQPRQRKSDRNQSLESRQRLWSMRARKLVANQRRTTWLRRESRCPQWNTCHRSRRSKGAFDHENRSNCWSAWRTADQCSISFASARATQGTQTSKEKAWKIKTFWWLCFAKASLVFCLFATTVGQTEGQCV